MMPRTRTFEYTVNFSDRDFGPVLDMMRYDSARVVTCTSGSTGTQGNVRRQWSVTLRNENGPTTDRWLSFGLRPVDVQERSF
jgi:hypothetical protein